MDYSNLSAQIAAVHYNSMSAWSKNNINFIQNGLLQLVEENHAFNYQLWNAEDRARRDDMGPEFVYHAKRAIDSYNQQRNNRMEAIDAWLLQELQPAKPDACPLHSETPGMIIDRLSILTLKIYHMDLQTKREDVESAHRHACADKLIKLKQQHSDLQHCLHVLVNDVIAKKRCFVIYRQFKMYNDPSLNPELYQDHQASKALAQKSLT